jgi:hypothetical protein
VAQRKGHGLQGRIHKVQSAEQGRKHQNMNKFAGGTQKGRTDEKRRWWCPGCKNGIRNRDFEEQLHLGSEGTIKKDLFEIVSVKIAKQTAGSCEASRKIKDWALRKGRPPPKRLNSDLHD